MKSEMGKHLSVAELINALHAVSPSAPVSNQTHELVRSAYQAASLAEILKPKQMELLNTPADVEWCIELLSAALFELQRRRGS